MLTKKLFCKIRRIEIMNKKGADMLRDPIFNKCMIKYLAHAFKYEERDRLGIRGFLMDHVPVKL